MNNEIKEILEDYKKLAGEITLKLDNTAEYESWLIIQDYVDKLFNYITNLQEEYDNEVEENLKLSKWLVEKQREKENYKSRIEKAIRLIEEYHYFVFTKDIETIYKNANKEFINILRGEDK